MTDPYHLQVVVQDRAVFDGEVTSIVVPGEEGYLGVLANHAPLLSTLGEGTLDIRGPKGAWTYEIRGGFLEVLNNEVTVLADSVVEPSLPSSLLQTSREER